MTEIGIPVIIVSGLGLLFGIVLSYASKKFEVKPDENIEKIRELLPGANCGACGFTGCDQYAEAVAGGAGINLCPVGGSDLIEKIADIMGKEAADCEKYIARVMCKGTWNNVSIKYDYDGIIDCRAAAEMAGGPSSCIYGCEGMGSCKKVCLFGAIEVENGLARIIEEKCAGCGKCIAECPKDIIKMVPAKSEYSVSCSNHEKGAAARKNCKVACIACQRCVKECPENAITIVDFCAVIDTNKCVNCGKCILVCPTGAINKYTGYH